MNLSNSSGLVQIEYPGPPSVLKYHTIQLEAPGSGEVLLQQKAIGVNFLDVFHRNGAFPLDTYPAPLGWEAAGILEAIGPDVRDFSVGDRVAYPLSMGAYAEKRVLKARDLIHLPADITFDQAASVMIKGLTAHMLVKQSHPLKAGQVALIHAMTGGVGTLLSHWARALGATVIGTVGSAAKKALALQHGFEQVIDLQAEDFADVVTALTQGQGIDVVYDSLGEATFHKSTALVKAGGSVVLYGWATGMPVIERDSLEKREIHFVQPALFNYVPTLPDLGAVFEEIFDLVRNGVFAVQQPTVYALSEAAQAHADLEARKTTGSIILRP